MTSHQVSANNIQSFADRCRQWTTQHGRYSINKKISNGSFGIVFEAEDIKRGEKVALKQVERLFIKLKDKWISARKALQNEIKIYKHLEKHKLGPPKSTPKFIRAHQITGKLVIEIIKGKTLREKYTESKLSIEDQLKNLLKDIRQSIIAVDELHQRNLVHNDLHLGNLMITEAGDLKIIDFGRTSITKNLNKKKEKIENDYSFLSENFIRLINFKIETSKASKSHKESIKNVKSRLLLELLNPLFKSEEPFSLETTLLKLDEIELEYTESISN